MIKKNIFSILVAVIIFYLSMTGSGTFSKVHIMNFPHADKLVHFLMYSGLTGVILLEHRKRASTGHQLFRLALFPFFYGILIEVLQLFTVSRSGDIFDALADTSGIVFSVLLWILFLRIRKVR